VSNLPLRSWMAFVDDPELDLYRLPGGAVGSGAIFTSSVKMTHVIRKVMVRMDAYTNYVLPN
jgi:hypothetical protein